MGQLTTDNLLLRLRWAEANVATNTSQRTGQLDLRSLQYCSEGQRDRRQQGQGGQGRLGAHDCQRYRGMAGHGASNAHGGLAAGARNNCVGQQTHSDYATGHRSQADIRSPRYYEDPLLHQEQLQCAWRATNCASLPKGSQRRLASSVGSEQQRSTRSTGMRPTRTPRTATARVRSMCRGDNTSSKSHLGNLANAFQAGARSSSSATPSVELGQSVAPLVASVAPADNVESHANRALP